MNTLIYHFGGLGDFITTLPLIAWWKQEKGGEITLLGKPEFGSIGYLAGYIDHIIDADSGSFLFLFRNDSDVFRLRRFFSLYEAVFLFAAAGSPLIENARKAAKGIVLCQSLLPDTKMHIIDYRLSMVVQPSSLTIYQRTPVISIGSSASVPPLKERISTKPMIAIHPGSGSRIKNWSVKLFKAVADKIRKRGYSILWITGPAEEMMRFDNEDLHVDKKPLTEIVSILNNCHFFIGNDSGITHLAAACGCPTIALFGPSDPQIWGPRGIAATRIIYHPCPCSPCHLKMNKKSDKCNIKCMNSISPEEVIRTVEELTIQKQLKF